MAGQTDSNAPQDKENGAYLWDENGDKVEEPVIEAPPQDDDMVFTEPVPPEEDLKKLRIKSLKEASGASSLGLFFIFAVIFAYFIGSWCDRFFGTKPILTWVWIGFGVAATVREAVRTIRAAQKLGDSKDP